MPTIDQLSSATAASDTDTLVSSQNGVARKVTRAQIVAGLQPQIAVSSGYVLGRHSAGSGVPEPVGIGANLLMSNGTLSATASPYQVSQLPVGVVPAPGDLVPLAQAGTNVAVTYLQFLSGVSGLAGIDASVMTISVAGGKQSISDFADASLPKAGGSMTGPLLLASGPSSPLQAATKQYVDASLATALPLSGGVLTGSVSIAGSLQCAGTIIASAGIATSSATLSGSLTVAGPTQLAAVSAGAAITVLGSITAGGALAGSALNVSGTVSVGGSAALAGSLSVQGGATIRGGVLALPQYSVATLPPATAGALAYATNGRKPGEAAGAGSGLLVWGTATAQWLSSLGGAPVLA